MTGPAQPVGGIRILILRRVLPGCEADFERRLAAFAARAEAVPGTGPVLMLRPSGPGGEYGILRTFTGPAERDAFYASDLFAAWEREIAPLCAGPAHREALDGRSLWLPAPTAFRPPAWKIAVATLLGVYPCSMLVPWVLGPVIGQWPHWLAGLAIAAAIVAALTWAVMPLITHVLAPWLHPRPPSHA